MAAPVGRRAPPVQLAQRPARRRGPHHRGRRGQAGRRRRAADRCPMGGACHRAWRSRAADGPGPLRRRRLAGPRGPGNRALLRDRPGHRSQEACRCRRPRRHRGVPGLRGGRVCTAGGADLAARHAVGAGARSAGRPGRRVHRGGVRAVLPADQRSRPGASHRDHLRQPRGGHSAGRRSARRATDTRHRDLVHPDPGGLHPRDPPGAAPHHAISAPGFRRREVVTSAAPCHPAVLEAGRRRRRHRPLWSARPGCRSRGRAARGRPRRWSAGRSCRRGRRTVAWRRR